MMLLRKSGMSYHDRGNISGNDYTIVDFTVDENWHDLDLSAIIGAGRKLVHVQGIIAGNTVYDGIELKTKGNAGDYNEIAFSVVVVTVGHYCEGFVWTDANGKVQYRCISIASLSQCDLRIRGWLS